MPMNSYRTILILSIIASFITTFTLIISSEGNFSILKLFQPMVLPILSVAALVHGTVFSFLAYWCLKSKNLNPLIFILYVSIVIYIVVIVLLGITGKSIFLAVYLFWIIVLLLVKFFWPYNLNKKL